MRPLIPLAALTALLTSSAATIGAAAAEPPKNAEQAHLEAEFYAAIGAEGGTYRQFRDRILQRGPVIEAFLTDKAQNGKTCQERTMAWILLERLQKKDEVEALLDAKPGVPYVRSWSVRVPRYRDALVAKAKETPMVLAESAWKSNRLVRAWKSNRLVWGPNAMAPEYAVMALGVLKERRATPVLIDYLERHLTLVAGQQAPPSRLRFACTALGSMGEARAVPVLLVTCLANPKMSAGDQSLEALKNCVDPQTVGLLRSAAIYLRDPFMKESLQRIVKEKEAEFAAKAKAGVPRKE
jgi:hypothetical protein